MTELAKTFDPAAIERHWYAHWEAKGLFHPDRPGAEPWTIVNPPPNVTGSLHIGHALDNTLQDILVRHARLQGKDALWVVGTDHAGIATQMVVERQMAAMDPPQKRTDFTREQFVSKVWDWKEESGGEITGQLRRLGCSMDWANERFTMDPGFSKAVLRVFVDLYNDGLLYRDKRLVNWDPGLGTAISDLEVETREVQGSFWHFRYPLADGSGHISVATTRPETMLADMAVAVNGEDARYQHLIGQHVRLPITGRLIPIIADDHADPELGSGAVKITPGHDFNDFEVGKRAGIEARDMLNMLDARACVVQTADGLIPDALLGLSVADARKAVVAMVEDAGLLDRIEDRVIQTPYGDRSGVVIEPWLTDQWYVDAATLAKPAIEAVKSGAIQIVPKSWERTFFHWMENIQPWCVSRQLWWGHRIPVWYGKKRVAPNQYVENWTSPEEVQCFVAETQSEAVKAAQAYYGDDWNISVRDEPISGMADGTLSYEETEIGDVKHRGVVLHRDPDVLDTWFSSALWPFATLGWPENPPRNGEGDHAQHGGGGEPQTMSYEDSPLHPSASPNGPPPRAGEDQGQLHGRYPNDILISGFDILFFWDARMMMQGLQFMGDVPFRKLYLHGLVRAADGSKMSKSKGNTVDPLGLIDRYGADALRFFMAAMESQGRDIKMDEKRVEGYRNFATKLWNAARFAQSNGIGASTSVGAPPATLAVNQWIIAETVACVQAVDLALADLRFDGAANAIYQFVWSRFCDWYLELLKPVLQGDGVDPAHATETRAVAGWVFDQILVLLHPFMPFITEELWHAMGPREAELIVAKWPVVDAVAINTEAGKEIDWVIRLVSEIRSVRTELNIPPGAPLRLLQPDDCPAETQNRINRQYSALTRLARLGEIGYVMGWRGTAAQIVIDDTTFVIPLDGVIDLDAERARLAKAIAAVEKERDALGGRLSNASFVERAKPEAVEKARADHAEKSAEAERLRAALGRLG